MLQWNKGKAHDGSDGYIVDYHPYRLEIVNVGNKLVGRVVRYDVTMPERPWRQKETNAVIITTIMGVPTQDKLINRLEEALRMELRLKSLTL